MARKKNIVLLCIVIASLCFQVVVSRDQHDREGNKSGLLKKAVPSKITGIQNGNELEQKQKIQPFGYTSTSPLHLLPNVNMTKEDVNKISSKPTESLKSMAFLKGALARLRSSRPKCEKIRKRKMQRKKKKKKKRKKQQNSVCLSKHFLKRGGKIRSTTVGSADIRQFQFLHSKFMEPWVTVTTELLSSSTSSALSSSSSSSSSSESVSPKEEKVTSTTTIWSSEEISENLLNATSSSLPTPEKNGQTGQLVSTEAEVNNNKEVRFNVADITRQFKQCFRTRTPEGGYVLELPCYVSAYRKLIRIFDLLGPIFSFASEDVRGKLNKLDNLGENDVNTSQNHYETMQNMFAYEFSPEGASIDKDGVHATRWTFRALKFTSGLIKAVYDTDSSLSDKAKAVYTEVLAQHHTWFVRMGVYMALLSLPSRDHLRTQIGVMDDEVGKQAISDMVSVIDAVYDEIKKLYVQYQYPL